MTAENRADIAVVGGGVTGMAAALAGAEAGARVVMIDAGTNAGSDANAGSLHVQLQSRFLRLFPEQAPNVEASLPLYLAAARAWAALDQRLGGVELVREGGLMVAEDEAQLDFLYQKAEREARHGLDVEILGRDALLRIAPWLGERCAGAELCRDEGKLNPLTANAKLRAALDAAGVVRRRARVAGVDGGAGRLTLEGGGGIAFDRAILAAAWGTGALAATTGVRIPVQAEPLHMNITEPAAYRIHHLVQHAERPITLKQFATGQIVIGGGWPARHAGGDTVPGVLEESLLGNIALAARIAPGIAGLRVLRTWAGLNTTADGKTILGALPGAGRVIAAVPGDAGYTLGPLVGTGAAALALGRAPAFDPAPYDPARFAA